MRTPACSSASASQASRWWLYDQGPEHCLTSPPGHVTITIHDQMQ